MTEQTTTPDPAPTDGLPPYSDDLVDKALSYVDQRGGSAARAEVILATEVRSLREVLTERNALRAELARVRPVVDAAREWKVYRDEHPEALPYLHPAACALYDAVAALERVYVAAAMAALDGDAAATPQPAAVFGPATECTCGHPVAHHDLDATFCRAALPDLSGPCPCMRFAVAALDGTRLR